jgi:lysophospholipase L1-like esterase
MSAQLNSNPFKIILYTVLILSFLSIINPKLFSEEFGLKRFDLFSELKETSPLERDHLVIETKSDSSKTHQQNKKVVSSENGNIISDVNAEKQHSIQQFSRNLKDLKRKKRKKIRIGYFGDSMIEGDLITCNIREALQDYFGGNGVGFVPITSVVAGFRQTIKHEFSRDWKELSFLDKKSKVVLPFSGHNFYANQSSWVKYETVKSKHLNSFDNIHLLYGKPKANDVVIKNETRYSLQGNSDFNQIQISQKEKSKQIKLNFNTDSKTPIYGCAFESDSGLILDNYSFRGISGLELNKMSPDFIKSMQEKRSLDLLILHYGPNLLYKPENTDFNWYKKNMSKTIQYLKKQFPNTCILLIGSADKAYRKNGKYVTAPGVAALIKVQKELAIENECAFLNLYETMGGEGTMAKWAEKKPILAYKDYTHFNNSGAAKVGRLITQSIMKSFYAQFK